MARTSRNSFNRGKNRTKVVHQITSPLVDADVNELQDILGVQSAENAAACFSSLRATMGGRIYTGCSTGNDWKPYANGTSTIFVTRGTRYVDGYQLVLEEDLDTTSMGVLYPPVGGSDVFGLLYVDVTLTEQDSTADPSLTIPTLGETSVRQVLAMKWGKSESTVSWEAAFTSIPSIPGDDEAAIWKGNTARVFVAAYKRTAGTTTIQPTQVDDLGQATPGELFFKQTFLKFHKAGDAHADEGAGANDGYVVWDAASGKLQIGQRSVSTDANRLLGAASLTMPNAPTARITNTSNLEYAKTNGAANGTPLTFDSAFGWAIPDGSALGFIHPMSGAVKGSLATRSGSFPNVYAVNPVPASQNPLAARRLTVWPMTTFGNNLGPGTFILCYRKGNDLIWWNGRVTRGNTSQPVLDDPTAAIPATYQLIVGRHGGVHGNAVSALETGINYLSSGGGAGALGAGRVVKALAQRGNWGLTRALRKYGTAAETAAMSGKYSTSNNLFQLDGDGPGMSIVEVAPPTLAGRAAADINDVEIRAQRIVLRNLTFSYGAGHVSVSTPNGYMLFLQAAEVVLENCHFIGSVFVNANNVTIRDCYFAGTSNTTVTHFAATNGNYVAQHLYLQGTTLPYTAFNVGSKWLVEGCTFDVDQDAGTHASVVVKPHGATLSQQTRLLFRHCSWRYVHASAKIPAFDVRNTHGLISVDSCSFRDARGAAKAGTPYVSTPTHPKVTNDYAGSLNTFVMTGEYQTAAYVAASFGRAPTSSLRVRRSSFHMGAIGDGNATGTRYIMWAAMALITNSIHAPSPAQVYNVRFEANDVQMFVDNTGSSAGWGASSAANNQPVIYGFICAPDIPHSTGMTSYVAENITVEGNNFDLGGHTTAAYAWRSVVGPMGQGNPTAGTWIHATSCAIGIAARKGDSSGVVNSLVSKVRIANNHIGQRASATSGTFLTALLTLSDTRDSGTPVGPPATANDIWSCCGIIVSADGLFYAENASYTGGNLNDVQILGNTIHHVAFTSGPNGHYNGMWIGFGGRVHVKSNTITLPAGAVGSRTAAVRAYYTSELMVQDNFLSAYFGVDMSLGGGNGYVSGNRGVGTVVQGAAAIVNYTGGTAGQNWSTVAG